MRNVPVDPVLNSTTTTIKALDNKLHNRALVPVVCSKDDVLQCVADFTVPGTLRKIENNSQYVCYRSSGVNTVLARLKESCLGRRNKQSKSKIIYEY